MSLLTYEDVSDYILNRSSRSNSPIDTDNSQAPLEGATTEIYYQRPHSDSHESRSEHERGVERSRRAPQAERHQVTTNNIRPTSEVFSDFNEAVWPALCCEAYTMKVFPRDCFLPTFMFLDLRVMYEDLYTFSTLRKEVRKTVSSRVLEATCHG